MAFFRRDKSKSEPADVEVASDDLTTEGRAEESRPSRETTGPFDRSEVHDVDDRLDLGALLVPGVDGMQMRLDVDQTTGDVIAVSCHYRDSALQLQAFAAPRTLGIWDDIRDEIAASIESAGGQAAIEDGRFGTELAVQMPSGPGQFAPARFIGADGPRWFLRGFLSGAAAQDDEQADILLDVFGGTVVVRGDQAMAPRDLLPLRLPDMAQAQELPEEEPTPDGPGGTDDLKPFERGPEITETR